MDCSEELGADDMITVQQMSSSSILMPGSAVGGARGGAAGGAELGRRLLLASRHGDTAAVLDLMARGAPFTTDWLGTSALHLAAAGAHAQTCSVLLRAGVSRDCRTKVDRTPLHMAAHAGHAEVVALLLEARAAVDCRDMLQMTPLHWAAARGAEAAARALLDAGADATARSKFHKTPLQLARAAGHRGVLQLLEAHLAAPRPAPPEPESVESPELPTAQEPKMMSERDGTRGGSVAAHKSTSPVPSTTERRARPEPIRISAEDVGASGAAAAAAMLRRHGITLLPRDEGSTVLSALQSGRSVVLSDAGKLLLKESSAAAPAQPPAAPEVPVTPAAPAPKVLLTATPVRSAPQGSAVKIFTLNNKLITLSKENKTPLRAKLVETGAGGERALRAQLVAAQRTIAQLQAQLAAARARIAQLERG